MEEKFSLKDFLFNRQKVGQTAQEIAQIYPQFDQKNFLKKVLIKFPELELKQRISWIAQVLRKFLPEDYQKATTILLKSLPKKQDKLKIGDQLEFEFNLQAKKDERVLIDYAIIFQSKNATKNKKVFKLKELDLKKNQQVLITKKHPLKANMTTRHLYPGRHILEIQINGQKIASSDFFLY